MYFWIFSECRDKAPCKGYYEACRTMRTKASDPLHMEYKHRYLLSCNSRYGIDHLWFAWIYSDYASDGASDGAKCYVTDDVLQSGYTSSHLISLTFPKTENNLSWLNPFCT